MAYRRIRFRNCRIQNSDARLVFEESKFCHITPLLRAPPPQFYTFKAPSPPLPHFYSFPPPTPHFYCFPFNITFTTFHCVTPPPPHTHTHTHTHTLYTHTISTFLMFSIHTSTTIVFTAAPPPPHLVCFPCTTTSTTFLLFPCSTTTTTFLLFSIHHHDHLSVVFPAPPPPRFYCFRLPLPLIPNFKSFPLLLHHLLIFMFSLFLCSLVKMKRKIDLVKEEHESEN